MFLSFTDYVLVAFIYFLKGRAFGVTVFRFGEKIWFRLLIWCYYHLNDVCTVVFIHVFGVAVVVCCHFKKKKNSSQIAVFLLYFLTMLFVVVSDDMFIVGHVFTHKQKFRLPTSI